MSGSCIARLSLWFHGKKKACSFLKEWFLLPVSGPQSHAVCRAGATSYSPMNYQESKLSWWGSWQRFLGVMMWLWKWLSCKTQLLQGASAHSLVPDKQEYVTRGGEGHTAPCGQVSWWPRAPGQLQCVSSNPGRRCEDPLQNSDMFTIKCFTITVPVVTLDSACCLWGK